MKSFRNLAPLFLALLLALAQTSCGGGGGDGGGGGSEEDGTKRTSDTSIRVIHGALDIEPVDIKVGPNYLGKVSFMDVDFMTSVSDGGLLSLERGNSPGVNIYSSPLPFAPKTEYTLLLSGQESHNNFTVSVLEEPVVRPEQGRARVQLINLLEGSAPLLLNGTGVTLGPVPFRLASGYVDVPSGLQTFTVTNDRGGLVTTINTTLADRGEATVALGGFTSEGVIITRVFTDLD